MAPELSVRLRGSEPPVAIPRNRIHFLFGSGRFSYDCVTCGAHCCKGFGYQLRTGDEFEEHVRRMPTLAVFAEHSSSPSDGRLSVRNCPPGCFFLQADNRCGVQVDNGYEAKPETCRLFPFNSFRLFDNRLIVSPHLSLCPLSIAGVGEHRAQSDHDALAIEMARAGINREITTVRPAIADGRKLIETEEEIVRLSEQCLDVASYSEFAAAQDEVWRTDERHSTHDRAAAASFRDLVVEVLGGQTSKLKPGDPSLTRLMVTMTPILRAEILFPPVTSADAPISPARATRMLSVIDLVAEFARASGMAAMTYHTITRLFHDFKPLLELLSMLDHEVAFRDGDRIRWPFPGPESSARRYLSLVRGILKSGRPGHERALGELLGTPTSGELLERVAYLKGVARCFTGILVPASSGSRVRRMGWHHHSRAAFQRWMVINLPDDRILRVRH